eukprot:g20431.t1
MLGARITDDLGGEHLELAGLANLTADQRLAIEKILKAAPKATAQSKAASAIRPPAQIQEYQIYLEDPDAPMAPANEVRVKEEPASPAGGEEELAPEWKGASEMINEICGGGAGGGEEEVTRGVNHQASSSLNFDPDAELAAAKAYDESQGGAPQTQLETDEQLFVVPPNLRTGDPWAWSMGAPKGDSKASLLRFLHRELTASRIQILKDRGAMSNTRFITENLTNKKYLDYPSMQPTDNMFESFLCDAKISMAIRFCENRMGGEMNNSLGYVIGCQGRDWKVRKTLNAFKSAVKAESRKLGLQKIYELRLVLAPIYDLDVFYQTDEECSAGSL